MQQLESRMVRDVQKLNEDLNELELSVGMTYTTAALEGWCSPWKERCWLIAGIHPLLTASGGNCSATDGAGQTLHAHRGESQFPHRSSLQYDVGDSLLPVHWLKDMPPLTLPIIGIPPPPPCWISVTSCCRNNCIEEFMLYNPPKHSLVLSIAILTLRSLYSFVDWVILHELDQNSEIFPVTLSALAKKSYAEAC